MDLNIGHCYTNNNKSCIKLDRTPETSLLLYFFSGVIIVATVFGNLFVVISVSHFKQLHTPTNFLVLSLAVADFLIGLLIMPFEFSSTIEYCWYFGKGFCPFYLNYAILLSSASVAHLVVISMDRYIAVCHPFFYSSKMTNAVMVVCISLVWLVSLLFTLIFLHFSGGSIDMEECEGLCRIIHSAFWWSIYLVFIFALPVAIMIFLYAIIFLVAKSHARAIRASVQKMENGESKKSNLSKSSERKAAKTLGIVVAVFIICVSPNFLIGPILESLPPQSLSSLFMYNLHDGFGLLFVINYGMNPFIYAFFYPWFQKSLKIMATFKIFQPASSLTNLFPEK